MLEQLVAAYEVRPLLFWVLGSFLLYVLVTNAAWVVSRGVKGWPALVSRYCRGLGEAVSALWFVGVPYLALGGWPLPPFSGLLSPADMGIAGLSGDWPVSRWLESAGTGLALGVAAVTALAAAWATANRGDRRLGLPEHPWWQLPIHGFYREAHWVFYRAGLSAILADVYVGIWAALLLVLIEQGLNPTWRTTWRDPGRAGHPWLALGLALLSTLLFLLTRNLWICIAVHWLVSGIFLTVARTLAVEPA